MVDELASKRRPAFVARAAAALGPVLFASVVLASCSGETAGRDASLACTIETKAQQIYDASLSEPSQLKKDTEIAQVQALITRASAYAARASEESGTWQPLAMTLDAPSSVSIPNLLSAATQQCEANL